MDHEQTPRSCSNCKHAFASPLEQPCQSCLPHPTHVNWEISDHPVEMLDEMPTAAPGRKFDGDKRDYTLLPWDALEEIVKVLEFGAKKYDRDNWKHVDDAQHRYTKAALRHLVAHTKGEANDAESGLSHLASWVLRFIFTCLGKNR